MIAHYEPDVLTATDYYPLGIRMPGRQYGNGPVFAGGDFDSTSLVNGYSLPADLQLSARSDRHPEEYVAAASIELLSGFSSSEGDSYQLYIADETYAGSGNQPPPGSTDGKAGYRFGFNGKENDNEVKGEGNQQDYGMRIYDPRMGKFLSVDPLTREYPWNSTYAYAENSPILFKDLDGLERVNYLKTKENGKTALKYSNTKDVYVWTWKPHMGGTKLGFTLWELIKNPDKKYVTYEPTEGTVEKFDKVQFVTYYQTISYDSYDDMVNDKNGSPGYEHAKFYLAKGVQNAREENMANGGAGMYVNLFRKEAKAVESLVEQVGVEEVAAQEGMTTVGRWMSKEEYDIMSNTGRMVEGAGGQTFVSTGGPDAFNAATKGSVYAEFQVPTNSMLQGGKINWFKILGPNAGRAMQGALRKQGGELLPQIQNLSPILKIK